MRKDRLYREAPAAQSDAIERLDMIEMATGRMPQPKRQEVIEETRVYVRIERTVTVRTRR